MFDKIELHPNMTPSEAANAWMCDNLFTDTGRAAIIDEGDQTIINYCETPHGIIIMLNNGTGLPVPYKHQDGDFILLS